MDVAVILKEEQWQLALELIRGSNFRAKQAKNLDDIEKAIEQAIVKAKDRAYDEAYDRGGLT